MGLTAAEGVFGSLSVNEKLRGVNAAICRVYQMRQLLPIFRSCCHKMIYKIMFAVGEGAFGSLSVKEKLTGVKAAICHKQKDDVLVPEPSIFANIFFLLVQNCRRLPLMYHICGRERSVREVERE